MVSLTDKISEVNTYADCRLAVGVATFMSFTFHLIMNYLVRVQKKFNVEMYVYCEKAAIVYGISCVLSMNYMQSNAFQAVLAWLTMFVFMALHVSVAMKNAVKLVLAYTLLIFLWNLITIIYFYSNQ